MKKLLIGLIIAAFLVVSAGMVMAKPAGYNTKARIFVGTGLQYCEQKLGITDPAACETAIGEDPDDHLVMKWSEAWHMAVFGPDDIRKNGDELSWSDAANQYGSVWCNNQWNGMFPGRFRRKLSLKDNLDRGILWIRLYSISKRWTVYLGSVQYHT